MTDSYLFNPILAAKIDAWVDEIQRRAKSLDVSLGTQVELFLQLSNEADCNYYFVDLQSKSLFWLEDCCTSVLGLLEVVSDSHLGKHNLNGRSRGLIRIDQVLSLKRSTGLISRTSACISEASL